MSSSPLPASSDYRIATLDNSSVINLYLDREFIQLDPTYQRQSDIWPLEKRRLLIDSVLNGFDIPKFYVHQFFPAKRIKGKSYKYAIIDGKQRLQTLWSFIEDGFPLGEDFELLADLELDAKGMTYSELAHAHPRLKALFDSKLLTVVAIQTEDTELIEEMFSRLNEAAPLNAAEKRNALGGPIPPAIRALVKHDFFTRFLPYSDRRYRHRDLACKLLFLEAQGQCAPTYKIDLDKFVLEAKEQNLVALAKGSLAQCAQTLDAMTKVFEPEDPLLSSAGLNMVYFMLFREARGEDRLRKVSRKLLASFEVKRLKNRETAETDISKANFDLLEFDRLTQSPNDGPSMQFRLDQLRKELINESK